MRCHAFFTPVPKSERKTALRGIRTTLEMFAKAGLLYRSEDLQWPHIGTHGGADGQQRYILFDLGGLENANADPGNDSVDAHLNELKKRIAEETPDTSLSFVGSGSDSREGGGEGNNEMLHDAP